MLIILWLIYGILITGAFACFGMALLVGYQAYLIVKYNYKEEL